MEKKNNLNELKQSILDMTIVPGAIDARFADLSKLSGQHYPEFDSAVSIVVRLAHGVLEQINREPTITYFSHYRNINRLIDMLTLKIAMKVESFGFKALPVPASQSDPSRHFQAIFPHKTAAHLSGMGWIGKNTLFIHNQWGSAVRLGTVLFNFPVSSDYKQLSSSKCGTCQICKKICPAMAIEGVSWENSIPRKLMFDAEGCSSYMKKNFQMIGRGSVCGLCMVYCPFSGIKTGENNCEVSDSKD
ncbi:MAG: 4Fe-4S double cluster binding domain-containing protein [Eubacteriaceae bacterium]|nr:4Fe-4S double cluster binding domain-containing protein [Eubacteriaceae bacterium]